VTGRSHQKEVANFCCELAINEMMHTRPEAARPRLAEALAHHRLCVRANMLLGDLEAAAGHPDAAIEAWKRIESQNPQYLALVADRLYKAFKQRDKVEEGINLLRGYLAKYPSLDLLNVVFQGTLESRGTEPAYQIVREELRRMPTLLGLDKLLEAQLLDAPLERRRDLELVKELVNRHTRGLAMYKCDNCGFRAHQYYWHCPACAAWETYSPRRTEEAKLPA
jgi:lipopolysaccharide biosynthesis regulator YciM